MAKLPPHPKLPVLDSSPQTPPKSPAGAAGKRRGPTRGATLARVQEVARAAVGDDSALDTAFAAFADFDAPSASADADAERIRAAQEAVRRLLLPR